jgi:ATP-dependent protease ClpP protease subunit
MNTFLNPQAVPSDVYGMFVGTIDPDGLQRFANSIDIASKGAANRLKRVHLAYHCNGGGIGEGIALYNLFRTLPLDLILCNVGTVSSIAVVAYLGAQTRMVSAHGAFIVHRTQTFTQGANTKTIQNLAQAAILSDQRTDSILRAHIKMPDDKWAHFDHNDLWFSPEDAVKFGLAHKIAEFSPPVGTQLFAI